MCGPTLEPSFIDGLEITILDTTEPMVVSDAGSVAVTIQLTNTGQQPIRLESSHPSTVITDSHGEVRTRDIRDVALAATYVTLEPGASQDFDLDVSLASCVPQVGYLVPPGDHFVMVSLYNDQLRSNMNSEPLPITIAGN